MRSVSWEITPDQFNTFLRTLRFGYHKWDTFACGELRVIPESIVLSLAEHEQIVAVTERLAAILRGIERRARTDPDALRQLGIAPAVGALIAEEVDSPMQLARYDFFPKPGGGWAVSEFNEDVPGGFNEIIAAEKLLAPYHPGLTFVDHFAETFLNAVPSAGRIALMYATGYSEDLQHMLVLESLLQQRGQATVLCSPRHLQLRFGKLSVQGDSLEAIIRFYPGEWFPLLSNRWAWRRAVARLPMMNPLCRLIAQSKAVFALWDQPGMVTESERAFLKTVAPHTESFTADVRGRLAAESQKWVIKQNFGRMGENVVMGSLVSPQHWDEAIAYAAVHPGDHVIQECFEVSPLAFSHGPLYPAIGAFVINGRFAGYYSRVAPTPFLTHQATYVPTVVDCH